MLTKLVLLTCGDVLTSLLAGGAHSCYIGPQAAGRLTEWHPVGRYRGLHPAVTAPAEGHVICEPSSPLTPCQEAKTELNSRVTGAAGDVYSPNRRGLRSHSDAMLALPLTSRDCEFPDTEDVLHKGRG